MAEFPPSDETAGGKGVVAGDPLLQYLVDPLPQRLFFKDLNLVYRACNAAFARDFGLEPAALIGLTDGDLFPAEVAAHLRSADRACLDSGSSLEQSEPYFIAGSAPGRQVRLWRRPVRDEQGAIIGLHGSFQEPFQERSEGCDSAAGHGQRYWHHAPFAMIEWDGAGRIVGWNPAAERLFGWSAAEMIGGDGAVLSPAGAALWEGLAPAAGLEQGCSKHPILTRRGDSVPCCWYHTLLPEGALSLVQDVSAEVAAQAVVKEQEEQLRLIIEHTPAAVAMFDREMRYLITSRRWLEDLHVTGRDLTGLSHYEVFPEIPERWRDIHRRCLAGAVERCEQDPFPRADGRLDWVRWAVHPWHEVEGRIGGIIIFSEVITERVEAQQALERIRDELEERVTERTRKLAETNDQLRATRERLRRAIDYSPFPSMLHAEDGQIMTVNRAWQRLSGYPAQVLHTISDWTQRAYGERAGQMEQRIRLLNEGDQPTEVGEVTITTADGSERIWVFSSVPLGTLPDGRRLRMSAAADITELKAVEEELNRIFHMSQDLICTTRLDGQLLFINDAWERCLGYRREALLQGSVLEWVVPEDRPRTAAVLAGFAAGKEVTDFENRYRTATGHTVWLSWRAVPDPGREVIYAVARDVTDRKQVEQERAATLRRYTMLVTALGEVTYEHHVQERTIDWGGDFQRVLGYAPAAMGHDDAAWLERVHPSDYPAVVAEFERAAREDRLFDAEYRFRSANGGYLWVNDRGTLTCDESGQPLEVIGVMKDITGQRLAEQALRREKETAQTYLNIAGVMMVIIDAQRRVALVNRRACEVLGWSEQEILGKDWFEHFIPAHQRELVGGAFDQVMHGDLAPVEHYDNPVLTRDGEERLISWYNTLLRDAEGNISGVLSSGEDITDRRHMEQALRAASEAAEAANRAKSGFLANMSHEIRTPMNAVLGVTHLLQQTELDPRQRDYLRKIAGAGRTLLGILDDILDFSKVEAGKLELERVRFNLDTLLEDLAAIISVNAREKDIEVSFVMPAEVPRSLLGDPLRLQQVLLNLVGNAIKFTSQGQVVVRVAVERRAGRQLWLHFSVADTGIGIAADKLGLLFKAFTQAESSTSRRFGGTGLGLTIAARLVELMEGTISVESEEGRGSTFSFTAALEVEEGGAKPPPPAELRRLRVLVVDDNPIAREVLTQIGRGFGWQVTAVASGIEALHELSRVAADVTYQVVLLDWRMPELDGIATAQRIRAQHPKETLPLIVMVTAYGRELAVDQGEQEVFDALLVKPVMPSKLLDTIATTFGVAVANEADAVARGAHSGLSGLRVLVVEDEPINREVAMEVVARAGAQVVGAADGSEALALLTTAETEPFDAVLMDVQMPQLDGYETTRRLRSHGTLQHLPIIAMTANALPEDRRRCLAAGMNDYVAKPIDVDSLLHTLARWTRRQLHRSRSDSGELPALEGFDVATTRQRLGGDDQLYRRLLGEFQRKYTPFMAELYPLLERDPAAAMAQLHALKGVGGNLGATQVQAAAGALEQQLQRGVGHAQLLSPLAQLEQALTVVLTTLARELPTAEPQGEAVPPAALSSETLQLLEELAQRLDENNLRAVDLLAALQQQLGSSAQLTALREAVDRLDFRTARLALVRLQEALGWVAVAKERQQ